MIPGETNVVLDEEHERWLPFCQALLHQAAGSFVNISGAHVNAAWKVFFAEAGMETLERLSGLSKVIKVGLRSQSVVGSLSLQPSPPSSL